MSTPGNNNPVGGRPVRLGLIGLGRWGRVLARNVQDIDDLVLGRAAGRKSGARRDFLPDGCVVEPDWHAVAAAADVDGVLIASPPDTHVDIAQAAVAAGKPVLVEKPLATDTAAAEALLHQAEAANAFVLVDHIHLYHPAYEALRARLRMLPPPRRIEGVGGNHGPFRDDADVLWDWGPHDVAMALDLAGSPPIGVSARRVSREKTDKGIGEIVEIELVFAGGLLANLTVGNLMADRRRRLTVVANGTSLTYDDTADSPFVETAEDGTATAHAVGKATPVQVLLRRFADGIRAGSTDRSGLELGVDVVRVLETCSRQLALKRDVSN